MTESLARARAALARPARTAGVRRLRAALWWSSAGGYMLLIWWLSSRQNLHDVVRLPFPHADKVIHIVEFGGLAFLACQALWLTGSGTAVRGRGLAAFAISVGYGALDEWHQSHVPTRSSDLGDVLADAFGAALVVLVWCRLFPQAFGQQAVETR